MSYNLGDESSDMAVDASEYQRNMGQKDTVVDEPIENDDMEDGWTLVSSRRNNGISQQKHPWDWDSILFTIILLPAILWLEVSNITDSLHFYAHI